MNKNIILFGGTFDPVHTGHQIIASYVMDYMARKHGNTELWFLPCFTDTSGTKNLTSAEHRINMLLLIVNNLCDPRFRVCTHEIEMANKAGTYAVVKSLINTYPGINFRYLIGMDQALNIRKWRNSRDLVKTIPFIVVQRAGPANWSTMWWYSKKPHVYIKKNIISTNISSSQIRNSLADTNSRHAYLNLSISDYIHKHSLYNQGK